MEQPGDPMASAQNATRQFWDRLAEEWGLLTAEHVRDLLDSRGPGPHDVESLRVDSGLLAVRMHGSYRYPGFQFDHDTGYVQPWVQPLLRLAHQRGKTSESVALWMMTPTTFLDPARGRPVDHLEDPDLVLDLARQNWTVEW